MRERRHAIRGGKETSGAAESAVRRSHAKYGSAGSVFSTDCTWKKQVIIYHRRDTKSVS